MIKLFWIIIVGGLILGCDKEKEDSNQDVGFSYLALGDSYTIGEGVLSHERFPYITVTQLRQNEIKIADPEYVAKTGWTTKNLINAINEKNPKGPYDIVTLLIGVNDQYQQLDTAGYRLRFTLLLNTSIELAGNKTSNVFVLSIPDYSATPFVLASQKERISKEIDAFNLINREVTIQKNVVYIDITPSTRLVATDLSLLAADRLHYSAKENQKWANQLVPKIKAILK